jgi:hypothetical protein
MSKVALSGNALGTGTFTIASPNGNTDRTINLPDSNGTILTTATAGVPVNGPAFSAYNSTSQSVSSATFTKVTLQSEYFDTAGEFSTATSRFTPTVAGYYQFSGVVNVSTSTSPTRMIASLYKNGAEFLRGGDGSVPSGGGAISCNGLLYLNGSTDYVELYGWVAASGASFAGGAVTGCSLTAFLARSAT